VESVRATAAHEVAPPLSHVEQAREAFTMRKLLISVLALGVLFTVPSGAVAASPNHATQKSSFAYKGARIDRDDAARRALSCVEGMPPAGDTVCFDTEAQAEGALGSGQATASRKRHLRARAADTQFCLYDSPYLTVYENYSYGGWTLKLLTRQIWYDLTGAYDDQSSSYNMGNHSGHIASEHYADGLGAFYPGDTGLGECEDNMSAYAYYSATWNNKASARYRN
jgi:hypothetical protein